MGAVMARSIKVETPIRCDWDHKAIEKGKYATQVIEGKAQGIYHGRLCYEAALENMEDLEKEQRGRNQDSSD